MKKESKIAAKQAMGTSKGVSPISGVAPPKERRFGEKNGNPRHNGAWKKEDCARFKLEKMMKLTSDELRAVLADEDAPEFERAIADIIIAVRKDTNDAGTPIPAHQRFQALEKMINQVYGSPAQTQVTVDAGSMEEKEKSGFIKGVFIPKEDENV